MAIGSKVGGFTPAVSVSVENTNGTSLQEYAKSIRESLKPAIDAGTLEIINEENSTINGNDAFIREVEGSFEMPTGTIGVKFKETVLSIGDKFYVITYTNSENDFERTEPKYQALINSFEAVASSEAPPETSTENGTSGEDGNGGCLIATAAHGTEMAEQVQLLREIRQNVLLESQSGTAFMSTFNHVYYSFSPTVADWERQSPVFREAVKATVTPMLLTLSILAHVDIDSEEQLLGYGSAIILLNLALYLGVPALLVIRLHSILQK